MKRLIPMLLVLALLLALLCSCSSTDAQATLPATHSDPSASASPQAGGPLDNPDGEPSLALPSHHPEETHHVEPSDHPEETHHVEPSYHPEETHHGESSHHDTTEPEPSLSLPPVSEAPARPSSAAEVDLQSFYDELVFDDPDFSASAELYNEYLDIYYPGLTAIPTKQLVVYQPMMSAVVCEIALVEVENSADIKAVIDLLQARIDSQVGTEDEPGGAWYPASIESWQNNSRIVSHGRYIMMIAYDKCDDVVAAFDALF